MESDCCAIILGGGKSSRMGFPKPFLDFEGRTFVEKIIETYRDAGIQRIRLVLNRNYILPKWEKLLDRLKKETGIIVNDNNIEGRLHSIKLGLNNCPNMDFYFIQNVDNPLIKPELLKKIFFNKIANGYTLPVFEGKGGHPILISKPVAENILKIDQADISLRDILSEYPRKEIPVNDSSILLNINTPEDYMQYRLLNGRLSP